MASIGTAGDSRISFCLRLPDCIRRCSFAWRFLRNAIKGFGLPANEKSAIVKAGGNPAIPAALDNFANFALQRHLGFPREAACNQNDPITNLKTGVQSRFLFHLSTVRRRNYVTVPEDHSQD